MIQDNTTKWKVRKFTDFASNQAMPVGYVHWSISPIVPAGELPLLGGTYDRSLYADLWSWANDNGLVVSESEWQAMATAQGGSCAKFSNGNGTTTFRVPSIKCWVKGANSVAEVGEYLKAGLPNVTGQSGLVSGVANEMVNIGAFYEGTTGGYKGILGARASTDAIRANMFDASRSNSIYGNSETVQPPSILGIWVIVAYGSISNIGNLDATNVMQAVEQVQTGLGKITGISDYIIESYRNGTEWYEVYKSGKVRQGGFKKVTSTNGVRVTFLKPFKDTNYTILPAAGVPLGNSFYQAVPTAIKDTNTYANLGYYSSTGNISWVAEGQGA